MSTPEGKVKEGIKRVFKRYDVYWHMPVQNGMGEPTLDFVACGDGIFIAVEAKAKGKRPTPRQQITMAEMQKAGAFVFVVNDADSLARLEQTLVILLRFPK